MKRSPLLRKTPLRAKRNTVPRGNRRWTCRFCPALNPSTRLRCSGCGIGRRTKRRSLARRCDALWARIVKGMGHGGKFCVGCGHNVATDAAHVVPRRFRSVRWLVANGRALCRSCHRRYGENEAAWRRFVGPDYDELWVKAQERWDGSYERVLRELREAQKERAA